MSKGKPLKLVKCSIVTDPHQEKRLKIALNDGILKAKRITKKKEHLYKTLGLKGQRFVHTSYVSRDFPMTLYESGIIFETNAKPVIALAADMMNKIFKENDDANKENLLEIACKSTDGLKEKWENWKIVGNRFPGLKFKNTDIIFKGDMEIKPLACFSPYIGILEEHTRLKQYKDASEYFQEIGEW